MFNVAKGLKKVKTAIYQALELFRDEGAAGSNPVIPTTKKRTENFSPLFLFKIHHSFYQKKIIINCETSTTATSAIGYVAAYAAATSSVPATWISVPRAGVLVMPPVIEPRILRMLILSTYFAKINPTIIGTIVIKIPYTK